jgi:hypothetical protein
MNNICVILFLMIVDINLGIIVPLRTTLVKFLLAPQHGIINHLVKRWGGSRWH